MTSEICQDMVAASEKYALEAPRAGGRWEVGGGEKKKKKGDTLLSHPEVYDNP